MWRRKRDEKFSPIANGPWYDLMTFLRGGGSPNLKDSMGMSLLDAAVEANDVAKVNVLIEYGCDVDAASVEGYTPVHRALHNKHNSALKLLLRANANANTVWGIRGTPLLHAIFTDNVTAMAYILTWGRNCDINMVETKCCHLPLAQAIKRGNNVMCALLLNCGASVEILNSHPERFLAYRTAFNLRKYYAAECILSLFDDPFQYNGSGFILGRTERGLLLEKRWQMIRSIIQRYSLATKCSMDNILLLAILDCREPDNMQLQMRKGELLMSLRRYGLVIHPQTILKFCRSRENNSACDTCRRAALKISDRIDVPSLKAQSVSVIRQNLQNVNGQISNSVVTWLQAYLPKSLVEFVYMQ